MSTGKSRTEERAVTYQTNQQFIRDFPDAENVRWNPGRPLEEVTFTNDHIEITAYYDVDSKLIGTTTEKKFADIPAKAQQYINKHFKGYNPESVIMFDDNEDNDTDMMLYNTVFEDADNYFVALRNPWQNAHRPVPGREFSGPWESLNHQPIQWQQNYQRPYP